MESASGEASVEDSETHISAPHLRISIKSVRTTESKDSSSSKQMASCGAVSMVSKPVNASAGS